MAAPTLLLLPSPLVGPAAWAPVAAWLREQGRDPTVVETGRPRGPDDVLACVLDVGHQLGPVVLVPHSNAGLYAPVLAERLDVAATVYVDAALAGDTSDTPLAPAWVMSRLRSLVDPDGLLPPWTRWWEEPDLDALFPDQHAREVVEAGQPRLPMSYFTARLPVPPAWTAQPSAYLAFGDTYADEIAFARAHGWPVSVVPGGHLQMLHDPAGVGAEVLRLEATLTAKGP